MDFFGDFGLRDTLLERIAPKPIEIDMASCVWNFQHWT